MPSDVGSVGRRWRCSIHLLRLTLLATGACTGTIEEPTPDAFGPGASSQDPTGNTPLGSACTPGIPPATTRLARLTHSQYDNTVRDLTGLNLELAAEFLADPHQAGFDRGLDLQVGDVLAKAYRDAAEQVASAVIDNSTAYGKVVGCTPSQGDSCARTFIAEFGKKAWRRPLSEAETTSLFNLFKQGPELVDTGDDFQKGVRVALEAMLQSPKFIYRVELSEQADGGVIKLNGYEVASRLSYLLVNTAPDATLLTAAERNQLATPDAVAAQATRLLASDAARETVRDFHRQWLDLEIYPNKLTKDAKAYPSVTPDLAPALQSEAERFVDSVTFERKRGFTSLMTAPFTFVNRTTAQLYGVNGNFADTLTRVDLNPAERAGLLTQVGFLASHAFSNASSPIHRGVFIQRRVLCNAIPDPPPNVPDLPPLDGSNIKTTREQVDKHTAPDACAGCHHAMINPIGFGLEHFDAVGRFRTLENGVPIDASGLLVGTATREGFESGVELSRAIADAPEARLCYVKNWFRYTLGRAETAGDLCDLSRVSERLANDEYTAVHVLTDLTRSQAFLVRAAEAP